jgi:glycosidase
MRACARNVLLVSLAGLCLLLAPRASYAHDFKPDVIYQIVTDRFFDGDTTNNDPPQSAGLYDPAHANWHLYWGGDLEGVRQKIAYLACMGVTAIWLSPPVDNVNVGTADVPGQTSAAYHGYQARDYKRIEEHFGDVNNSWAAFDNLVAAAHENGIKVIVDFAPNHTNYNNRGEYGALYDDGKFLGDYPRDANGYFHHEQPITDRYDRYQTQYRTLYDLADINQENAVMDAYLKEAAQRFQQHGADGFRLDGVKHMPLGWQESFVNTLNTSGDSFIFGEWYLEDPPVQRGMLSRFYHYIRALFADTADPAKHTADPLYHDAVKLANKSGMSLLNFPLNAATRNVFGVMNADFAELDAILSREATDFRQPNSLVNFIDSHDIARLLSLNPNPQRLHEALALVLTTPGIPCIYYGTEQYLHDDTNGGRDPYNRPMMSSFSTSTTAYALIGQLSNLRQSNPALAYGTMQRRWLDRDVYVYERVFAGSVVLIAINKSDLQAYEVSDLQTALPPGVYADYLDGQLGGLKISVEARPDGALRLAPVSLPAHSVSVWSYVSRTTSPLIEDVGPAISQPGVQVTIDGGNFGAVAGTVTFDNVSAAVTSWSDDRIRATVPAVTSGNRQVRVVDSSGQASPTVPFTVLTGTQLAVTFKVKNAPPTKPGENIFVVGNAYELGGWQATWNEAVGPLMSAVAPDWFICAAVPSGQLIEFKFVKLAADGTAIWEAGANHSYSTPTHGTGEVEFDWQY